MNGKLIKNQYYSQIVSDTFNVRNVGIDITA